PVPCTMQPTSKSTHVAKASVFAVARVAFALGKVTTDFGTTRSYFFLPPTFTMPPPPPFGWTPVRPSPCSGEPTSTGLPIRPSEPLGAGEALVDPAGAALADPSGAGVGVGSGSGGGGTY